MFLNKIEYRALLIGAFLSIVSCQSDKDNNASEKNKSSQVAIATKPAQALSDAFKGYWYGGKAEITSYALQQSRYGEVREGTAVLVYVTEDFLPDAQVKADNAASDNIGVLKLNATKNFNTGIYPYHIMQSTFFPVANNQHALKVSVSVQEWCGQVYAQINNRTQFEVQSHSYFQSEADETFNLNKTYLENELWVQLRINPKSLPVDDIEVVPSLEYLRLKHQNIKAYKATAALSDSTYTLTYPDLNRILTIEFNAEFPYSIRQWEETYPDGRNGELMTTTAVQLKTITEPYWQQNRNEDGYLRDQLSLD
ncbi:septum formation inhibitor Maf [Paucihalobacter sp.]|uniref:septum formation inhibitor Maf n=1 Tax=Paucihalobacter sp. TaxID=2850405 RepID=UPI002FE330E8